MRVTNEQWEDSLRNKRYPLDGFGDVVSDTGMVLPDDVLLDLNLMVVGDEAIGTFDSVIVAGGVATATFFTAGGVTDPGTTSSCALTPNTVTPIIDGAGRVVGYLRTGSAVPVVTGWPNGVHVFGAPIIPHLLVLSSPKWLSGFELPSGDILTGDVYLVADVGLYFEAVAGGFRFHVTGDPFHGRTAPARGIKTVNGVTPTDGNINFIGLSTSNYDPTFVAAGQPFRIDVTPSGVVTLTLVGA